VPLQNYYDPPPFLLSFLLITGSDLGSGCKGGLPRRDPPIRRTCYFNHASSDWSSRGYDWRRKRPLIPTPYGRNLRVRALAGTEIKAGFTARVSRSLECNCRTDGNGTPGGCYLVALCTICRPTAWNEQVRFFIISGWCNGKRGWFFRFIGARITPRYGMVWTILHLSCRLGYRLTPSSTRRSLPTRFIMNWTRWTTTCVWKFHLYCPLIRTHPCLFVDDPETFKDAPICIQVIGKTLEEEAVIAMGEIVDLALKAKLAPSKLWFAPFTTRQIEIVRLIIRDIIGMV